MLPSQIDHFRHLEHQFRELYGQRSLRWIFAPGRVNLIGEHVDYCGGWVLPTTIHHGTYGLVATNGSDTVNLASTLIDERISLGIGQPLTKTADGWFNYPKGVLAAYRRLGADLVGMDVLYGSTIPGGGLSSSASFCVATALLLEAVTGFRVHPHDETNRKQMALLCQKVENEFVGVSCGIMDQAVIALGQANRAIKLDCRTLQFQAIDCSSEALQFVIMNTCRERRLVDSKYNERVGEMQAIISRLGDGRSMSELCELKPEDLDGIEEVLADPRLFRRVSHVINENHRVSEACSALEAKRWPRFGQLMVDSHRSLSRDYEVTGPELDTIVELSLEQEGVLGARMTGAGFGGCAIALVQREALDDHNSRVGESYRRRMGYGAEFYPVEIGPGAQDCTSFR